MKVVETGGAEVPPEEAIEKGDGGIAGDADKLDYGLKPPDDEVEKAD